MLNHAINEEMFEFALNCKYLMQRGWDIIEIKYGEERLGVGPKLILQRGDEVRAIYDYTEVQNMLNEEIW